MKILFDLCITRIIRWHFCLGIPDIDPIIGKIKGNLNTIGKLKFINHKKFTGLNRINGIAFGVHPNHQKKGL